jgi:DGQHR domain-containing protein
LTSLLKRNKLHSFDAVLHKNKASVSQQKPKKIVIEGLLNWCGNRKVFLGFAPAKALHAISFADVLNEETGKGYQRRFNDKHSLDFRKYIQGRRSTTIPLTFNLRPRADHAWELLRQRGPYAALSLATDKKDILSQVDCQHRLGYLSDLDIPLAFMSFIGLDANEEMEIFNTINGKSKGLNSSLLDYHETKLAEDLGREKPQLLIAMQLNEQPESPWHKQLDLGGHQTSGMARRASLRTMQKAAKRFLNATNILKQHSPQEAVSVALDFWKAVSVVLEDEWLQPRKHFLTKGIGVYSLMSLAADLYMEAQNKGLECNQAYFVSVLSDFVDRFDWTTEGPLKGLGGEVGANEALALLRELRKNTRLRVIGNGK